MRWLTILLVLASAAHAAPLRVVTYNLNFANPDRKATLVAIEQIDADIVLLQEVSPAWQRDLEQRLATRYPNRRFHAHQARLAGGIAVLSKLPIASDRVIDSPLASWFPAELVTIDAPFGPLQIVNLHLRPAVDGDSWVKGYLTTPPLRRREIEAYWPSVAAKLPTIVAGDFNEAVDGGRALAFLVKQGLTAAAADGPETWHYELLKINIDHVLVDDQLAASDGHVLDVGTSDHRPVVVTITKR